MKQYLHSSYKSKKEGIQKFWLTLTPDLCKHYINHLHTVVILKVVEVEGNPSGY